MAYQSLYRKYRPQTFSDVVGQGHVARTLQNALASGRIAHGFLFTGTRGTAKTTIARILAKALNCESSDKPVAEPCNECGACKSITAGNSIDVIEMDAASHRGVADMEEVRKAVGYGPMELRYKVFIIDEAHQLSSDAKDAFLKTLEEPPDNVVFILATTEPQAIPITIRSRCQQFDFKRGSLADIAGRLRYVLDKEGVTYAPEILNLVARGAEGSYRDSLSLLEQVLAYAPQHLTTADIDAVLGTLDAEMLARVTEAIARRDAPATFALAGELLDAGKEARTLLRTLAAHFRDLLLVSVGGPAVAVELTPEEVGRLQGEAREFTPNQMMRAMDILNEAQGETRWNNQHRLLVELTFLKLMSLDGPPAAAGIASSAAAPVNFVTAPIVYGAGTAAVPPQATVLPAPTPTPAPKTVVAPEPAPPVQAAAASVPPPPALLDAETETLRDDEDDALPADYFSSDDVLDDEDEYTPEAAVEAAPPPIAPILPASLLFDDEAEDADAEPPEPIDDGPSLFDDIDETPPVIAAAATAVAAAPQPLAVPETEPEVVIAAPVTTAAVSAEKEDEEDAAAAGPGITIDHVWQQWGRFLKDAEKVSMRAKMLLADAQPSEVVGKTIVISFPHRMNYDMMEAPDKREFVRKLMARTLGVEPAQIAVRFVLQENAPPAPARQKAKKKIERDPLAAIDLLDSTPGDLASPAQRFAHANNGNSYGSPSMASPAPPVETVYSLAPAVSTPPPPVLRESAPPPAWETKPASREQNNRASATATRNTPDSRSDSEKHPLEDHPLVQEARSLFGGDIVTDE